MGISLVDQLVKNPPAMQETSVHSLDKQDSLEKGMANCSVFLPGEFHGGAWQATVHRVAKWMTNTYLIDEETEAQQESLLQTCRSNFYKVIHNKPDSLATWERNEVN